MLDDFEDMSDIIQASRQNLDAIRAAAEAVAASVEVRQKKKATVLANLRFKVPGDRKYRMEVRLVRGSSNTLEDDTDDDEDEEESEGEEEDAVAVPVEEEEEEEEEEGEDEDEEAEKQRQDKQDSSVDSKA